MASHSQTIGAIATALAKAQAKLKNPTRNRTVEVETRAREGGQRGGYEFSYATLDTVLDAEREVLSECDLACTQLLGTNDKGALVLVTLLVHGASGEWFRSELPVSAAGMGPQATGSGITYARRYSICPLLGIAAEDDDDAQQAQKATRRAAKQERATAQPGAQDDPKKAGLRRLFALFQQLEKERPDNFKPGDLTDRTDVATERRAKFVSNFVGRTVKSITDLTVLEMAGVAGGIVKEYALKKVEPLPESVT